MSTPPSPRAGALQRRVLAGARNALELIRLGRLGETYSAPYDVVDESTHHRLRRYTTTDRRDAPVALMVPPLMVTAEVYDVAGRRVATLIDDARETGPGEVRWRGHNNAGRRVSAGVYFVRVRVAGETRTSRVVLVR